MSDAQGDAAPPTEAPVVVEGIFLSHDDGSRSLAGTRCRHCGTTAFPPRRSCLACQGRDVEAADLGTRGSVFSFARADMAMPGYEPGHLFGMVELHSGPRIYAHFQDADYDTLAIGEDVELVAGPIRVDEDGNPVLGPKFRPVRTSKPSGGGSRSEAGVPA